MIWRRRSPRQQRAQSDFRLGLELCRLTGDDAARYGQRRRFGSKLLLHVRRAAERDELDQRQQRERLGALSL